MAKTLAKPAAAKPKTPARKTKPVLETVAATPAQADSVDLLRRLSETVAVSGDEGPVRRALREIVTELADEVRVDTIGNLFAIKHGPARAPRVLLTAHMDEIGFMIVGIDSDGLLKFEAIGGIDDRILLGKPVWVGENKVPGVIGMKPIHLVKGSEVESIVKIDSLRIDVGASNKDGAGRLARPGTGQRCLTLMELGRPAR